MNRRSLAQFVLARPCDGLAMMALDVSEGNENEAKKNRAGRFSRNHDQRMNQ